MQQLLVERLHSGSSLTSEYLEANLYFLSPFFLLLGHVTDVFELKVFSYKFPNNKSVDFESDCSEKLKFFLALQPVLF